MIGSNGFFFLENIMRKMGFHEKWVWLIMKCVFSVSYKIKVNDSYTSRIFSQRVLRQVILSRLIYLFYVQKGCQLCYKEQRRWERLKVSGYAEKHQE